MGIGKVPGLKWKKGMVYGHISAPECCRADMGTGMVPGHIWARKWCPGPYWELDGFRDAFRKQKGVRTHMGTGRVPRHMWAPEGCPGTYGHRCVARAHMET